METDTQALVEKAGRMSQFWADYQRRTRDRPDLEWPDAEYQERKRILLEAISRMEAELAKLKQTIGDYGWQVSRNGQWHRTGEPVPSPHPPGKEEDRISELLLLPDEGESPLAHDRGQGPRKGR